MPGDSAAVTSRAATAVYRVNCGGHVDAGRMLTAHARTAMCPRKRLLPRIVLGNLTCRASDVRRRVVQPDDPAVVTLPKLLRANGAGRTIETVSH
jgi:hypothetical protein